MRRARCLRSCLRSGRGRGGSEELTLDARAKVGPEPQRERGGCRMTFRGPRLTWSTRCWSGRPPTVASEASAKSAASVVVLSLHCNGSASEPGAPPRLEGGADPSDCRGRGRNRRGGSRLPGSEATPNSSIPGRSPRGPRSGQRRLPVASPGGSSAKSAAGQTARVRLAPYPPQSLSAQPALT